MTEHTEFYTRLDSLQERVAAAKSAVRAAAAESDAQLKQRIDKAQADLDQSVESTRQQIAQTADSARGKWAQLKADAAAKTSDVKANIDKRTRHVDAKVAACSATIPPKVKPRYPRWRSGTERKAETARKTVFNSCLKLADDGVAECNKTLHCNR